MTRDKEKIKANRRRYYLKHKDEINAKHRARYAARIEQEHERSHAYYEAHKAEHHARMRRWRAVPGNKEREKAWRKLRELEVHTGRNAMHRFRKKIAEKCKTDAAFFAECRAKARTIKAKRIILCGGTYKPRYSRRIPDYLTKSPTLDTCSAFLVENLTASQRAYARELAIERMAARH